MGFDSTELHFTSKPTQISPTLTPNSSLTLGRCAQCQNLQLFRGGDVLFSLVGRENSVKYFFFYGELSFVFNWFVAKSKSCVKLEWKSKLALCSTKMLNVDILIPVTTLCSWLYFKYNICSVYFSQNQVYCVIVLFQYFTQVRKME